MTLGSLMESVQYKRAEWRLLLSELAFIMMRTFLQNHRFYVTWVSHKLRERERENIEMGEKIARQPTAGTVLALTLRVLCSCILCRSISFSLFRIVLTLAYTSITNPAGQTQSCIYAQALAEQPTWANLIAPSPSMHSRITSQDPESRCSI